MSMRRVLIVARRVMTQFIRDHRSVAMMLSVPIMIMSLLSVVVDLDVGEPRVGLFAEGTSSLFAADMVETLSQKLPTIEVFDRQDGLARVAKGELDALVIIPSDFLEERVRGGTATIAMHLAGDNPARNGSVLRKLKDSLSGILDGVPALLPDSCTDDCSGELNTKFPKIREVLLHGKSDLRLIDFHASFFATYFVFFFGFIFSSLAFFRERTSGTLERLLVSPLRAPEIFGGYLLAFFVFGMIQSTEIILFLVYVLKVYSAGPVWLVYVAIVPTVLIAEALGIFVSAYSRREFQVVQFVPIVVLPQVLLSNLFWPVEEFPNWLRPFALLMPAYHADAAARQVLFYGRGISAMLPSVGILFMMLVVVMLASARQIRKAR